MITKTSSGQHFKSETTGRFFGFDDTDRHQGSVPERSVMFEDSMKNIRGCKNLGMGTVLLTGAGGAENASLLRHFRLKMIILPGQARDKHRESTQKRDAFFAGGDADVAKGESTKIGDTPQADDPAVDVAMGAQRSAHAHAHATRCDPTRRDRARRHLILVVRSCRYLQQPEGGLSVSLGTRNAFKGQRC